MSLEEALAQNTAALTRVADLLGASQLGGAVAEPAKKAVTTKKAKAKAPKPVVAEVAAPVVAAPVAVEPVAEVVATPVAEVVATPVAEVAVVSEPAGSAPITEGSEWYKYTMDLCARYSAQCGNPEMAMQIAKNGGVTDLSQATDEQLYPIAQILEKNLGIAE